MIKKFGHRGGDVTATLRHLQKKHRLLLNDMETIFVGGLWHRAVVAWVAAHQRMDLLARRNFRASNLSQRPGPWERVVDETASKMEYVASLIDEGHGAFPSRALSFFLFADACCPNDKSLSRDSSSDVCPLPFTLEQAVALLRRRDGKSLVGEITRDYCTLKLASNSLVPLAAEGAPPHLDGAELLAPRSADLIALDFTEPEHATTTGRVWRSVSRDAMVLASHLLRPTGSVVLRLPLHAKVSDRAAHNALMKYLRWSFQRSACEMSGEQVCYVGCGSGAGQHIAEFPKSYFPGLLEKSTVRPRQWNPRVVRNRSFFTPVTPSYACAPQTKERSGRATGPEGSEVGQNNENDADAYFALAVEMVERGLHNQKRDD
ncbi:hypothetical protein TRVL_03869 [Trypanosoma vivax]|nr:hypothetical protein TRVL_03869 [Trypanosoma vivax]